MGSYDDWLVYVEHPTEELARRLGAAIILVISPSMGEPAPPVEIREEHRAALMDAYRRERMSQAAGLSPSWYRPPPAHEPRA